MPGPIPLGKKAANIIKHYSVFLASLVVVITPEFHIQTGLKSSDLDLLKLVSRWGIEKWPVRDLFKEKLIWKE